MTKALEIENAIEPTEDHRLIVAISASLSAINDDEDGGEGQLVDQMKDFGC